MINQIQDDTGAEPLDRGRRHRLHRCHRRRGGRGRAGRGQRDRQPDHARGRRALPRHRRQDDHLRCVRLAAPGQGRPAAHHQAARARRWQAGRERRGRRLGRPEDPGRDRRDRRPRQAVAGPRGRGRLGARRRRCRRRCRRPAPRLRTPSDPRGSRDDRPAACCRPVVRLPSPGTTRTLLARGRRRRSAVPSCPAACGSSPSACPAPRSATIGVWVGVGSRDESPALHGCSHFLEHLLFKGTARALGAGHLGRARRGRRRVQRLHRQGVHLLPRPGARRRPAAGGRRARRHGHRRR